MVDVLLHRKLQNRQDWLLPDLGLYLLEDIGRLSNLGELVVVQLDQKTNHQHHRPVKYHQVNNHYSTKGGGKVEMSLFVPVMMKASFRCFCD